MKIKKTVIFLGYECNNDCIFCCNSDKRNHIESFSFSDIKKKILLAKKNGSTYIEFIGGEPTIRKDIFKIVLFAKKIGFKTIMFATNGRMFSNLSFAKKIIDSGINHVVFSIHGPNEVLHDSLTKVQGSFDQLIRGVKNLQKIGFTNIGSNTTIVKQNYSRLFEIGKLIYSLGIRNSEFIFVDPTQGNPKYSFNSLVPSYKQCQKEINALLKFGKDKKVKHWHIRYYPLCFIDQSLHNRVSESLEKKSFDVVHFAPDFTNKNVSFSRKNLSKIKIKKCINCIYTKNCEGVWKEYLFKKFFF